MPERRDSLQTTQLICLLGALLISVAAALRGSWSAIALQMLPMGLLLFSWLPAVRKRIPQSLDDYLFAAIFLLFLVLSGVGHPSAPSLGPVGFIALHGVLLGFYGIFLGRAFFLFSRDRKLEEDLEIIDLWLANIGLMLFAAVFIVSFLANSSLSILNAMRVALAPALIPLTACVAWLMLIKCQRAPGDRRVLMAALIIAPVLAFSIGSVRAVQTYRHICIADRLTDEAKEILASETLAIAKAENQSLQWPLFQNAIDDIEARLLMRNADPQEQLSALAEHLVQKNSEADENSILSELLKTYLQSESLDKLFLQVGITIDRDDWNALHDALQNMPEEERLLQLKARTGSDLFLLERYNWSGLDDLGLEDGWQEWVADAEADAYLKGLVLFRQGDNEQALLSFKQALQSEPNDHNTIVWVERVARELGDLREVARLRKRDRRLILSGFSGNLAQGVLRGAAWTALELHEGLWEMQLVVRSENQQRPWPELSIYLDENSSANYRGQISGDESMTIRIEIEVEQETRKRLLIEPGVGDSGLILEEIRMFHQEG